MPYGIECVVVSSECVPTYTVKVSFILLWYMVYNLFKCVLCYDCLIYIGVRRFFGWKIFWYLSARDGFCCVCFPGSGVSTTLSKFIISSVWFSFKITQVLSSASVTLYGLIAIGYRLCLVSPVRWYSFRNKNRAPESTFVRVTALICRSLVYNELVMNASPYVQC